MEEIYEKLDVYMNVVLVNNDIRPAMMIQPQDYDEETHHDHITSNLLQQIKKLFPNLIQTTNYEEYQGVIISKTDYTNEIINLTKMGKILGYPCADDFMEIKEEEYTINIYAITFDDESIQIFPNICKNLSKIKIFEKIASDAKKVFQTDHLLKKLIKDVIIKKHHKISPNLIIQKIIRANVPKEIAT